LLSVTKTISIEFGKQGINANSLSPASVETPMSNNAKLPEGADYDLLKKILPFDGIVRPASDVASLVAFLASDDAVHINGIDVRIDGGMMT
ncbi:MAG: SDR family oxidoreductase, partial [Porticoccaceae bacterium]|nr:SDR family oxidoreductase [Porticoccaceae bacterium]